MDETHWSNLKSNNVKDLPPKQKAAKNRWKQYASTSIGVNVMFASFWLLFSFDGTLRDNRQSNNVHFDLLNDNSAVAACIRTSESALSLARQHGNLPAGQINCVALFDPKQSYYRISSIRCLYNNIIRPFFDWIIESKSKLKFESRFRCPNVSIYKSSAWHSIWCHSRCVIVHFNKANRSVNDIQRELTSIYLP